MAQSLRCFERAGARGGKAERGWVGEECTGQAGRAGRRSGADDGSDEVSHSRDLCVGDDSV